MKVETYLRLTSEQKDFWRVFFDDAADRISNSMMLMIIGGISYTTMVTSFLVILSLNNAPVNEIHGTIVYYLYTMPIIFIMQLIFFGRYCYIKYKEKKYLRECGAQ
jgi:hypothetical protein